ncbi:hypothetical protein [Anabaena sp. PCC 7108]|uniref:hypothetical protein n=1 Tax=Anabaena sp. PCC 7108 TaxID=163908 RepID=UPI000349EEF6|nr:hypothetical protein [Anabaena sp. PCC 7108]
MINQATLQLDQVQTLENNKFQPHRSGVQNQIITSAWQELEAAEIDAKQIPISSRCICLNLDNLKPFEAVDCQYQELGVIFHNSLAIEPSNPLFSGHSGLKVLMGSPQSAFLEATFLRPVNLVSSLVISSQRLVLSAYDQDDNLLTQSVLPTANLVNSDSGILPNQPLSVTINNITRVNFCCFDGHFTLDEFKFCFSF